MTSRKPLIEQSLKAMNVPKALRKELLQVDALGLDCPMPTETLVEATLARCKEALSAPPTSKAAPDFLGIGVVGSAFGALIEEMMPAGGPAGGYAALCVSFASQAVSFSKKYPQQAPVVLVDNYASVAPGRRLFDPSLALLDYTLRDTDVELELASGQLIDRVIIAREDPSTYDEKDLRIIRHALLIQASGNTYLVRGAKGMGKCQYAVIGDEVVFEIGKDDSPGASIDESQGHLNRRRATEIRGWVKAAKSRAVQLMRAGRLESEVEVAVRANSTQPLLNILKSAK